MISARNAKHLSIFQQEVELLRRTRNKKSPFVVHCYGSRLVKETSQLFIFLECADMDFERYTEQYLPHGITPLTRIAHFWRQMAGKGQFGTLKLADFGLARALEDDKSHLTKYDHCGTTHFIAPESLYQPEDRKRAPDEETEGARVADRATLDRLHITTKSDIWSLGIILYQLLHLQTPYESCGRSRNSIMFCIIDARWAVPLHQQPRHMEMQMSCCAEPLPYASLW
eukprot:g9000.t1